ncbi:MAG: hypothetical protein FD138_4609 [Planctomycetota bacterium]|nr:MAG: hypothetical protein FD138_4609 [Planctomycetota bacterium]
MSRTMNPKLTPAKQTPRSRGRTIFLSFFGTVSAIYLVILTYQAVIHVQAAPQMPLHEAHTLGGRVKGAIRTAVPQVQFVLVRLESFEQWH